MSALIQKNVSRLEGAKSFLESKQKYTIHSCAKVLATFFLGHFFQIYILPNCMKLTGDKLKVLFNNHVQFQWNQIKTLCLMDHRTRVRRENQIFSWPENILYAHGYFIFTAWHRIISQTFYGYRIPNHI